MASFQSSRRPIPALRRTLRELLCAARDLLLPWRCPACGVTVAHGLCLPCDAGLERRSRTGCARCGEPVLPGSDRCQELHRSLMGIHCLRAPFGYAGTGGALVRRCKLDGDPAAGLFLARSMADAGVDLAVGPWRHAVLVAVPLHRQRRRERGFDQAEWLARAVGERLGLAVAGAVLRRTRATLPQGDPRVTSREQNVAGAFAVARPGAVAGQRVVLVDDVFTSGATARACAGLLRAAGAREVALLTACRS